MTPDKSEMTRQFQHGSHIARTLLNSNDKHSDLPLVIHMHACMVLGCSEEDDCFERMEDAVVLIGHAMEDGLVPQSEGEAMLRSCEYLMGMRGQVVGGGGWRGPDGSGSEASESEGEGEGEEDGGEQVLP